jgi:uncharacterized membrane protein YgdD (TMEM256/DUF423 family)
MAANALASNLGGRIVCMLAALHGLSGVAFSAIASHVAGGDTVMTAAIMQLVHAPAAIVAVQVFDTRAGLAAALAFVAGSLAFAAGLYASGLGGTSLGPVAPAGGMLLMLGWLLLAVAAITKGRNRS